MTQVGDSYRVATVPPIPGTIRPQRVLVAGFFRCDECLHPSAAIAERSISEAGLEDHRWFQGRSLHERGPQYSWLPVRPGGRDFPDVPEHIASAADEAYRSHSIGAYRGAGALARAVVEATAKDKGITSGTLAAKIAEMERQQLVRPMVREAADEVRHMGNDVAHGDFVDPVEEEESSETLALMAEVLEEVYVAPARLDKRRTARLAKKQQT